MYPPGTRLYVELIPDENTCKILADLTKKLTLELTARAVDPAKWHVTILHFGVPEHVYYDIQRDQPNLSRTTFMEAFKAYVDAAKKHIPKATTLQPTGLELLGINQNVLALMLEPNEQVIMAHARALEDVVVFLKACGVNDPDEFMKGSINFKWAHELKPHITLLRSVRNGNPSQELTPEQPLTFSNADVHGL